MSARIEVSYGEPLDKITILEIKSERIRDPAKLANIKRELSALASVWNSLESAVDRRMLLDLRSALKATNEKLWEIEDALRDLERIRRFDDQFVELARSVYITNDARAARKREVDLLLGSRLMEEKSYQPY